MYSEIFGKDNFQVQNLFGKIGQDDPTIESYIAGPTKRVTIEQKNTTVEKQ